MVGSLGLCLRCRATAARMLIMCTWKYMDLGGKNRVELLLCREKNDAATFILDSLIIQIRNEQQYHTLLYETRHFLKLNY